MTASAIQQITPARLRNLLASLGWIELKTRHDDLQAFRLPDAAEAIRNVVQFPRALTHPSWPSMAEFAIGRIHELTDQPLDSLRLRATLGPSDIFEVRALGGSAAGTIPLQGLERLANQTRQVLGGAARGALNRINQSQATSKLSADNYLKGLRAGPTAAGSYILTVVSPLGDPRLTPEGSDSEPELVPINREVNLGISGHLQNLHSNIGRAAEGSEADIDKLAAEGLLRRDVCQHLALLVTAAGPALEISLRPDASVRGLPANADLTATFYKREVPVLKTIAKILKARQVRSRATVRGVVTDTHRNVKGDIKRVTIHGRLFSDDSRFHRRWETIEIDVDFPSFAVGTSASSAGHLVEIEGLVDDSRKTTLRLIADTDLKPLIDQRYEHLLDQ